MSSNNIIVREYLGSLKEDKELDYLFPILLNSMGFRIVQTAKESKGQSQYGKDIIAIGKNEHGEKFRWYFELKGYGDRDITDKNYSSTDGIRESIIEAKDTAFNDTSIPEFNQLPIKIVLVHNGVLKTNIRPTFEGFISKEFKDGEFERWDIYYLTDLFSKYLFSEYLLSDSDSNRLFKKTLAFLDTPDNNYTDFKQLVNLQFAKIDTIKGRAFTKLFATLNILESIIFHYSIENNNLIAAKECSKYLTLYTWSWILKNKLDKKIPILREYNKLTKTQYDIFNAYFSKTFNVAKSQYGLFSENGAFFERIGYPLRCFDYLDDIIYYCRLREHFSKRNTDDTNIRNLRNRQKDLIIELIQNNNGFYRPILDNNSIPIMQLFVFFSDKKYLRQKDVNFITSYIFETINNILISKIKHNLLPELYSNVAAVSEAFATGEKPEEYYDTSSMLLPALLELLVIFNAKEVYEDVHKFLHEKLSLQIPSIDFDEYDVEQLLFERHLHQEYHVDYIDKFFKDFEDFEELVGKKVVIKKDYRTDKAGFSFLRYLAHSYYKNEILPEEWRIHLEK